MVRDMAHTLRPVRYGPLNRFRSATSPATAHGPHNPSLATAGASRGRTMLGAASRLWRARPAFAAFCSRQYCSGWSPRLRAASQPQSAWRSTSSSSLRSSTSRSSGSAPESSRGCRWERRSLARGRGCLDAHGRPIPLAPRVPPLCSRACLHPVRFTPQAGFRKLYSRSLLYWLPVQCVQFSLVPQRYKVVFLSVAGLLWTTLLSVVAGSVQRWRQQRHPAGD